ncbi:MAG: hypothetical protein QXP28_06105 [Archaeoglobaceae archaeon]
MFIPINWEKVIKRFYYRAEKVRRIVGERLRKGLPYVDSNIFLFPVL